MCTLSLTPVPGGLRLVFNRDELLSRPQALPPATFSYGLRTATHPIDPQSGGTWFGFNDAGVACAILNHTPHDYRPAPAPHSRGTIVPTLLHQETAINAASRAESLALENFPPFRLIILDHLALLELVSDGHALLTIPRPLSAPIVFTSSGLGDHLVGPPRRALFERFSTPTFTPDSQDVYHHHQWPIRKHLSVFMSRPDARTVSITTVELPRSGSPRMTYIDTAASPEMTAHDLCAACY